MTVQEFIPEGIVVLGRGIERSSARLTGGQWKPTRLIEKVGDNGQHLGFRPHIIDPDAEDTRIGGSNANALAAYHLYRQLADLDKAPMFVAFAAGRPDYLADTPTSLSEGIVLLEKFIRKTEKLFPFDAEIDLTTDLEDRGRYKSLSLPKLEIVLEDTNKTSTGDINQSLELARQREIKHLAFLTVSVHVPRCNLFLQSILLNNPAYQVMDARFISSDSILSKVNSLYKKAFDDIFKSESYATTSRWEMKGMNDFLAGRYKPDQTSTIHK